MFEQEIKKIIKDVTKLREEEIVLEKPKQDFGDYAFPCFVLSKKLNKNPVEIAKEIALKLHKTAIIEDIKSIGPYINFFINKQKFASKALDSINKKLVLKHNNSKKTVLVETPGPNTNKPLHVGHLRNAFIGQSIANLFQFFNYNVKIIDVINDRGIHICKSMLAYQLFGKNKTPEQNKEKSDHFVGDYYVMFNQKSKENKDLEIKAQELLKKWENNDPNTIKLWEKMNFWAISGIQKTYNLIDLKHSKKYLESQTYKKGKSIVLNGLKKKYFYRKEDGAIAINLGEELGEKILLRNDGTSLYITQDIYLAFKRYEDFKFDKLIYVVANEQDYHFKVLFNILKILKYNWASKCYHLSYGMVNLPSGKMKSREGTIIDADDLIEELKEDSKKEILSRYPELKKNPKELDKRALAIALSAIRFNLLKKDSKKDILFDKQEALDFEGFSGPYIQYSYARASKILEKVKLSKVSKLSKSKKEINNLVEEQEFLLIKKMLNFFEVVENVKENLKIDLIATYSYELAKQFSNFYHSCPVVGSDKEEFRVGVVKVFRNVMKKCLDILKIEAIEEM